MEPSLRQYTQNRVRYVVYRVNRSSRNTPNVLGEEELGECGVELSSHCSCITLLYMDCFVYIAAAAAAIPPIWFGLAFLRTRLPCSDPTTDDKNSRVELAVGT